MAAPHVLFVVHGMGDYSLTPIGSPSHDWVKPIKAMLEKSWREFPNLRDSSFAKQIEVVPITYGDVFHAYLTRLSEEGKSWNELFDDTDAGPVADFIEALDDDEAGFLLTHVGDVLLFLSSEINRAVMATVMEQIVDAVNERWDRQNRRNVKFSVLAHSLGTAVMHEALNRMAHGRGKLAAFAMKKQEFRVSGYAAIANVSRILHHGGNLYGKTLVRPRVGNRDGYVRQFVNVHHAVDPFVFPNRFAPTWKRGFRDVKVAHVYDANVHGFEHYLRHPEVVGWVFQSILGDKAVPNTHIEAAGERFRQIDASNPAKVRQMLTELEPTLTSLFASDGAPAKALVRCGTLLWKHRKAFRGLGVGA